MIIEALKEAGFTIKEAQIYTFLIRFGQQPASTISVRTKINRTTTYQVLRNLVNKGIVSRTQRDEVTVFKALSPKQLLDYLETEKREQKRRIEKSQEVILSILPALQSLKEVNSTKPKVSFFEGEKGIRQAYERTLSSTETILSYSNFEEMHKRLPHFLPNYYIRRNARDIDVKCITPKSKKSVKRYAKRKQEGREVMIINPKKYNFTPEICVYDDNTLIVSWKEKMAIHIESSEIAELLKMIHKTSWGYFQDQKKKKK